MLILESKTLKTGDTIARKKLVDAYNTSNQGGITPSTKNKLIFIFSDPNIGEKFGYNDGWKKGVFLYSGRGPKGDMEMTYGNRSIIALAFKFLSNADLVMQTHWLERELFIAIWIMIFGL